MTKNTEMLCDENGIEIVVAYKYEKSGSQVESCHGDHEVGLMTYTELDSVEVVIKGQGINILPLLNSKQKEHIIEQLNYE